MMKAKEVQNCFDETAFIEVGLQLHAEQLEH